MARILLLIKDMTNKSDHLTEMGHTMTATTTELTQGQHHLLLEHFVETLRQRGYDNIRTRYTDQFDDLSPANTPYQSKGIALVPDIYAEKDDNSFIFEIELAETIGLPKTSEHLDLLANCAKVHDVYFYLVVPEEIHTQAKEVMEALVERDPRRTFVMPL